MEKVLEVQQEIKENASEVQDFLKDLDSWAQEMEAKDKQLKAAKKEGSRKGEGEREKGRKEEVITMQHSRSSSTRTRTGDGGGGGDGGIGGGGGAGCPSPAKKERIRGDEYSKWDKFDVEAECSKLEDDGAEGCEDADSGDGESTEEEEALEEAQLKQQAVAERERGNTCFKAGKYEQAVERYTAGMQCDPLCPILPANRAMAFLKTGQFGAAERDSSISLSLDPSYVKAFQRRASARIGLGKLEEAVQDYERILQLEPSNRAARGERDKLKEKISANKRSEDSPAPKAKPIDLKGNIKGMFDRSKTSNTNKITPTRETLDIRQSETRLLISKSPEEEKNPALVTPITKPPHLRSKKPLKRINVVDVENPGPKSSSAPRLPSSSSTTSPQPPPPAQSASSTSPPSSSASPPSSSAESSVSTPSSQPKTRINIIEVDGDGEEEVEKPVAGDREEEVEKAVAGDEPATSQSRSRGFSLKIEKELMESIASKEEEKGGTGDQEMPSHPPATYTQFNKDWRRVPQHRRMEYLRGLKGPTCYRNIFKSNMEAKHLTQILEALHAAVQSGQVPSQEMADHLLGLCQLPRVSALAMFLSQDENKMLGEILNYSQPDLTEDKIKTIHRVFSL